MPGDERGGAGAVVGLQDLGREARVAAQPAGEGEEPLPSLGHGLQEDAVLLRERADEAAAEVDPERARSGELRVERRRSRGDGGQSAASTASTQTLIRLRSPERGRQPEAPLELEGPRRAEDRRPPRTAGP